MTPRPERIGVVLAGGRSRRMGRDKARLTLGSRDAVRTPDGRSLRLGEMGPTWLERTLAVLRPAVTECWVVGREVTIEDCPSSEPLPPSRIDGRPGTGPLAGMETALEIAGGREVLVVACDLPDLGSGPIARILEVADHMPLPSAFAFRKPGESGSRVPVGTPGAPQGPGSTVGSGRLAGLLVLLRPQALPSLRASLDRDERRVETFLRTIDTCWIEADEELLLLLRNANRPEDLGRDL